MSNAPAANGSNSSADAPDFLPAAARCYAHRHMKAALYGFYSRIRQLSHKSGVFWADCERDAWELSANKETISIWMRWLVKAGWLVTISRRRQNPKTGKYSAGSYRALSHEEWVKSHGRSECRYLREDILLDRYGKSVMGKLAVPQQNPQLKAEIHGFSSEDAQRHYGNPDFATPEIPTSPQRKFRKKIGSTPRFEGESGKEKSNSSNNGTMKSSGKLKPPTRHAPRARFKTAGAA
jgi:hypothetical protein